eukprot:TRINITY_DN9947_c0_g2_i1.p1 TRINITY_DN9947_c0_g2~~TRINITY_DN9947_c0_g2_i1.p1  ORF type:complete len:190 (-),score=7.27 TRINITY_DN9947_c0_g2_i1:17-541(-)
MATCRARSESDALQSEQSSVRCYRTGAFTMSVQHGSVVDATQEADGKCGEHSGEEQESVEWPRTRSNSPGDLPAEKYATLPGRHVLMSMGSTGFPASSSGTTTPGSLLHPNFCKPCAFHKRSAGCRNGNDCEFCHSDDHRLQHQHAMYLRGSKKPQKQERQAMRERDAIEHIKI